MIPTTSRCKDLSFRHRNTYFFRTMFCTSDIWLLLILLFTFHSKALHTMHVDTHSLHNRQQGTSKYSEILIRALVQCSKYKLDGAQLQTYFVNLQHPKGATLYSYHLTLQTIEENAKVGSFLYSFFNVYL